MQAALESCPTLVLNADFRPLSYFPLSIWPWQDAVKATLLGRVNTVAEYDRVIRSPSMEMALPSVVSGLIDRPVIAVPTSVGYGASFGGLSALFGMLNSCAPGLTVVNIDNGFGAGYAAAQINRG